MKAVNPFKFGTIVDGAFFTDREKELTIIKESINSENHLILISPRRFGKTSLVKKAIKSEKRKSVFLDIQLTNSIEDFAAQYLRHIYAIYPTERIRHFVKNFRIIPGISLNPATNDIEISFQPNAEEHPLLEDVFNLLEKLSSPRQKAIVVLDEFQDISRIGKGIDRVLRSIIQNHKNINYIFLGSQESMMQEIFEKKKSPFYHFGQLLYLSKIEQNHFKDFITRRFKNVCAKPENIAGEILEFTKGHPYYTQQLAYNVWNLLFREHDLITVVKEAIDETILIHDFDYERLWLTFNSTDKKTLIGLISKKSLLLSAESATMMNIRASSTIFSSLKRLMRNGYIMKIDNKYEIDDPFFREWIINRRRQL
ncbi:MAG: ATP-binding protein [Prolixibacteraceae bacterium]|nr:ATP-binding protein [Prolixibacteraceae bacterium]